MEGKHLRKIASLLLALVLCLGMTSTAFASTRVSAEYGSDNTYAAYQIFSGTYSSSKQDLTDIVWGNGIADVDEFLEALVNDITIGEYFDLDMSAEEVANVLAGFSSSSAEAYAFANVAADYVNTANGLTITGTSSQALSDGYWLILETTNVGTGASYNKAILFVAGDSTTQYTIETKTDVPTVEKKVDQNDTYIGGIVTFTLTGTVPAEIATGYVTYTYQFVDTLSSGLTYEGNLVVTTSASTTALVKDKDYSVTTSGQVITITLTDPIAHAGETITVTYNASLNEDAVVGSAGNLNTVYIKYTNNPVTGGTGTTTEKQVKVFTFELDGSKIDGKNTNEDGSKIYLEGAKFVLKNSEGLYYYVDEEGLVDWVEDVAEATEVTSDKDGNFSFVGIGAGTYYLVETQAPDGYNTISDQTLIVTASYQDGELVALQISVNGGTAVDGNIEDGTVSLEIANYSGLILPGTGGMGTTLIYACGGLLILAAVVLLITRRRRSSVE